MFSRTTMASSISMPMARDRAIRVITFRVMPRKFMTMKEEMTEMGRVKPGDHRGTPGIEEEKDDEDGEDPAEDQGLLHIPDGVPDHDRGIPDHLDRRSRGKFLLKSLDLLLHPVHHAHGIGPGLFEDVQADGRDAVHQGQRPLLFDAVPNLAPLRTAGSAGRSAGR